MASTETSHKGGKVKSYPLDLKKEIVDYAIKNSNREAGRRYSVDEKRVREWRNKMDEIKARVADKSGLKRRRLDGGGRKITTEELEEEVDN